MDIGGILGLFLCFLLLSKLEFKMFSLFDKQLSCLAFWREQKSSSKSKRDLRLHDDLLLADDVVEEDLKSQRR